MTYECLYAVKDTNQPPIHLTNQPTNQNCCYKLTAYTIPWLLDIKQPRQNQSDMPLKSLNIKQIHTNGFVLLISCSWSSGLMDVFHF